MNLLSISIGGGSPTPAATFVWSVGTAVAAGVILFLLNWGRELLTAHWKRKSEAGVLAFTLASQLDQFISDCSDVVARGYDFDEETGRPVDMAKAPIITFSNDLPWWVFPKELQHQIRSLPNMVDVANRALDETWRQEHGELLDVLEEREERYAEIGLVALAVNDHLSVMYGVPKLDRKDWRPEIVFQDSLDRFEDWRERQQAKVKVTVEMLARRSLSLEELLQRTRALDRDLTAAIEHHKRASSK
ncbi:MULTISPECIES: hypothetical protein [Sinorhizobium]|uniref:hypothetical protein n=1 Tax=Sinorhizobium TaxID=28105 RepID=UPI000BEA8190|nr:MULTISPECIES: hypothetical protein [Sinorhizobium]PDT50048.1 hypothetical protein CO664_26390 [Sinorhizobium sp. NG07B]POH33695.1 hypothetical protein ATY30_01545 [Sinorhizobium americanum]